MTVHTTYFAGLGSVYEPPENALVLGVVRKPHDWVRDAVDRNAPVLGPPEDLLEAIKSVEAAADEDGLDDAARVAWESTGFERRYREHLDRLTTRQVVDALLDRLVDGESIVLVCYERDARYCHRRLLAEHLAERASVDVVHHPDPDKVEDEAGDEQGLGRQGPATLDAFTAGNGGESRGA